MATSSTTATTILQFARRNSRTIPRYLRQFLTPSFLTPPCPGEKEGELRLAQTKFYRIYQEL